ncbi:MAG: ABC transporter substrate-binding protein, partial [Ferrovibrionaceae bacterium]
VHPRFQIMWAGDTPFTFHTENTAASIVAALGGDNIAGPMTQNGRFGVELSLEKMLEKDPEVIFVYDSGPDRPHENNPIWSQLSAVRNKRVFYVGDHWVESNGPIARQIVLREAAHYLYPQTFPAVDVRAEAARLIPAELVK